MTRAGDEAQRVSGQRASLPPGVQEVFEEFRTCEFSTLARDGTPITWPTVTLWQPQEDRFVITTSIGLSQKALNIRSNPKVSLSFSDPTASGIEDPPAVLVQGDAEVADAIKTSPAGFEEYWKRLFERQPAGKIYGANPLTRYLMDWYYMRLYIFVRPHRITWRPRDDFERAPEQVEVTGRVDEVSRYLPEFPTAVLNGLDAQGYPYSVRCRPAPDRSMGTLRLSLPPETAIRPGPASLLCHGHDEELWNLKSFLVRGRLERGDEGGWTFVSERFVPGAGIGGAWGTVRAIIDMRRSAARYLRKRGLARPSIPWGEIEALKD